MAKDDQLSVFAGECDTLSNNYKPNNNHHHQLLTTLILNSCDIHEEKKEYAYLSYDKLNNMS